MVTRGTTHTLLKRRPGRPRGTAPFRAADEALLRQAADALVCQDAANLTAFLRDHDVTLDKDLARLRARWREIGNSLLAKAAGSATARVRQCVNLVIADVDRITKQAEVRHSWDNILNELRADLVAGATYRLSDSLARLTQDCVEHRGPSAGARGDQTRGSRSEGPVRVTGQSTGDLLFLCARLLDQRAVEAWNCEGGLVDDHETAPN